MQKIGHCLLCLDHAPRKCFQAPYSAETAHLFVAHATSEHGVPLDALARTWCSDYSNDRSGVWLLPPGSRSGGNHIGVPWLQVVAG